MQPEISPEIQQQLNQMQTKEMLAIISSTNQEDVYRIIENNEGNVKIQKIGITGVNNDIILDQTQENKTKAINPNDLEAGPLARDNQQILQFNINNIKITN